MRMNYLASHAAETQGLMTYSRRTVVGTIPLLLAGAKARAQTMSAVDTELAGAAGAFHRSCSRR